MTDNGAAALAAALRDIHPGPRPWPGGMTSIECAAAILGERGVFLPDGRTGDAHPRPTRDQHKGDAMTDNDNAAKEADG